MSIDQRTREGLHRNAEVLDPDIDDALDGSRRRGKRMLWIHRASWTGATAATLTAVVIGLMALPLDRPNEPAQQPASPQIWQTEVRSRDEVIAQAIDQGADPACAASFVGDAATLRYTLVIEGDRWTLYRSNDGKPSVGVENGFWDAPESGQLRLFEPNAPASYLFDRAPGTSDLDLEVRRLSLGGDPDTCLVKAGAYVEFGAPFARVDASATTIPPGGDDSFGIGTASVDGTWASGPVSEGDLRRVIEAAGAGECADDVLGRGGDRRFTLSIQGDRWVIVDTGDDDRRVSEGWVEVFAGDGPTDRFIRFSVLDQPETLNGSFTPSEGTLDIDILGVERASSNPSCFSRARAAVWFASPFEAST